MERHYRHSHFLYNYHIVRFIHNRYNDFLIADTLRTLALSLISLFIPIFLIKEAGYSFTVVATMEIFLFVGSVFFHHLVLSNITRWGTKKTMIFSYFLNVVLYLSLFYYETLIADFGKTLFLLMVFALEILSAVFYWTSHHVYFFSVVKKGSEGRKVGVLYAIPALIGIAGPLLGAYMIDNFSFRGVFLFSSILLSLASYSLFFTKEIKVKVRLSMKKAWDLKAFSKNMIYFIHGWTFCVTGFFWPLFLFINSIKLVSMGLLFLFSNLAYSFVAYIGGRNSDKKGCRANTRLGAIGQSFSLVLRVIANTIYGISIFQVMGGIFGGLMTVNLNTSFYKRSHKDYGSAIMNREIYMHLGRIVPVLLFLFLHMFYSLLVSIVLIFVFNSFLLFYLFLLARRDNKLVA